VHYVTTAKRKRILSEKNLRTEWTGGA